MGRTADKQDGARDQIWKRIDAEHKARGIELCYGELEHLTQKEFEKVQLAAALSQARGVALKSGDAAALAAIDDPSGALAARRKIERQLWRQAIKDKTHTLGDEENAELNSWLNWLAKQHAKFGHEELQKLIALEQEVASTSYRKEKAEVQRQKDMMAKYAQNVQSFLYRQIPNLKKLYAAENPEEYKKFSDHKKPENIHKLSEDLPAGSFNDLLTTYGGDLSGFVRSTPAQLALLQPVMRYFIVDQAGNEKEIYFSDYTTEEYAKDIANIRARGDIKQILSPRNQRGSDAGIRSFTWNYNNKHEGDYIIEAEVELYFGTLAELANVNYLQFLFPTGNATELAGDLATGAGRARDQEQGKGNTPKTDAQRAEELQTKIDKLHNTLQSSEPDATKVAKCSSIALDMTAGEKKQFRQLKVVVGWSMPEGNKAEMLKLFDTPQQYESFKRGVGATQRAIFLNLADYNVDFTQEGPTTMNLRYIGSTDNYLATAGSDIFGSSNLDAATNKFMFTITDVPVDGIVNENGILVDVQVQKASGKTATGNSAGYLLTSFEQIQDPYIKHQARISASTNRFGEPTIGVTLGGLKKAQELVSLKIRQQQLMNAKEDSVTVERLRQSGQFLTLLYERAATIRIRDIYSKFLDGLLNSTMIYGAAINPPSETGKKPTIEFVRPAEELKKIWDNIMLAVDGRAGPRQPVLVKSLEEGATMVHFMRLGDIIKRALEVSGGREDVSFILGNVERFGTKHSLYDIPITVDTFGQFFFNSVVTRKRRFFPLRYFLNDLLKSVAAMINQDPTIMSKVAFDWSVVSTKSSAISNDRVQGGLPFVLTTGRPARKPGKKGEKGLDKVPNYLELIRRGQKNPLAVISGTRYHHFYPIYETKVSLSGLNGDRVADEKRGIYHYVIGSDRGLAKTFNFSRQEAPYFQEMLIESNNLEDKIQALFLPQNVSITMYGNTQHKNGDLIFVDSRPSLGSFAGPVLGIGGYYRVIRSSHRISNRGYETTLDCVFQLRVSPDKTAKANRGG